MTSVTLLLCYLVCCVVRTCLAAPLLGWAQFKALYHEEHLKGSQLYPMLSVINYKRLLMFYKQLILGV